MKKTAGAICSGGLGVPQEQDSMTASREGCCQKNIGKSGAEVVTAVVAVENAAAVGEPALALPDVPLSAGGVDDGCPPVIADEEQESDRPPDKEPAEIVDAEQDGKQAAVFARFVGKLYAEAAAFGAADVECQETPSFFVMISRAGGVVKRMDDDWGRRTPGVAILRQQMGGCGT